jgi:alpha-ketoglutarate-dependent taurine dioxygenase
MSSIEIKPLTIHTGAEISGIDLNQPISDSDAKDIWDTFLKWKVVFFRNQPMSHADQVAFGRRFGELTIGHAVFGHVDGYPEIYSVAKDRWDNRYKPAPKNIRPWTGFHADITAAINPPAVSILRGVTIPPYGGDTLWANLVVAYDSLSEPIRNFVDGLRALHKFQPPTEVDITEEYRAMQERRQLTTEHPMVRVHPETGERVLYISPSFLKSIVGLEPRESELILEMLWEHSVRPEFSLRYKWEPNDLAMWDNRAVVHCAPRDIYETDFDRQLYRITMLGDIPVGVDGRQSELISGEPIAPITAAAAE